MSDQYMLINPTRTHHHLKIGKGSQFHLSHKKGTLSYGYLGKATEGLCLKWCLLRNATVTTWAHLDKPGWPFKCGLIPLHTFEERLPPAWPLGILFGDWNSVTFFLDSMILTEFSTPGTFTARADAAFKGEKWSLAWKADSECRNDRGHL